MLDLAGDDRAAADDVMHTFDGHQQRPVHGPDGLRDGSVQGRQQLFDAPLGDGVDRLVQDILYDYVSLDPVGEMDKYFQAIQPLLGAITEQAKKLGLVAMNTVAMANLSMAASSEKDLPFATEKNRISQQSACPDSTSS